MGTIIVALLAFTMAIFPISMPRAAASTVHVHAAQAAKHAHDDSAHSHHGKDARLGAPCHHGLGAAPGCDRHDGASHGQDGSNCCGGMGCHSFQVSAAPIISSPVASPTPLAIAGDEQVAGIVAGRLDRPPRTV
jgi:hypothetical protein